MPDVTLAPTLVVGTRMPAATTRLVVLMTLMTPVAALALAIPLAQLRALMTMIHAVGLATTRLATPTLVRLPLLQTPFPLGALARSIISPEALTLDRRTKVLRQL